MGERKKDKANPVEPWFFFGKSDVPGFGTHLSGEELRKRVRSEKDERMITNYLAARDVIRNLQKMKELIVEQGLQDIRKEVDAVGIEQMGQVIKKILRG